MHRLTEAPVSPVRINVPVGGAPLDVDAVQYERWGTPAFLRGRAPGPPTPSCSRDWRASSSSPARRDGGWRVQNPAPPDST